MSKITPFLWFDGNGEEAARFYASVFPDAKVGKITYYGPDMPMPEGTALTVEFELFGQQFVALNGGPQFQFTEAVSFQVDCADQAEVDRYWEALTADGGEEGPCGWCKDRFGLSWQIVPRRLMELINDSDPEKAQRAMQAMMAMRKIVVDELEQAAVAA